jgi:hypothetical protein
VSAAALLSKLEALGVAVMLNAAGDGLRLRADTPPPAALLDEVRASKAALLEALAPKQGDMLPPLPWEDVPGPTGGFRQIAPDPLPDHLARLVSLAKAGKLPSGTAKLAGGIAPDLSVYVLAWGECWPRDRAHVLRRLEEAYAVTVNV